MAYYWPRIHGWEGDFVTYLTNIDRPSPSHCDWIVPGTYFDPEFP